MFTSTPQHTAAGPQEGQATEPTIFHNQTNPATYRHQPVEKS